MTQTVAGQFRQYWTPILQPYADKAGIPVDYLVTQLGHESMWGTITPHGSNNYAGIHEFRNGFILVQKMLRTLAHLLMPFKTAKAVANGLSHQHIFKI